MDEATEPGQVRVRAASSGEPATSHDLLRGAAAAGLLAGAAMLAWAVLAALIADQPPHRPLAGAAATFAGDALDGGAAAVAGGLLVWAAVSVACALVFAALVPRDFPFVSAALMGVGYAFVLMGFATSAVLPRLNPEFLAAMTHTGGMWVLAYAVFGVALGSLPALRRRLGRGPPRAISA